MWSFARRLPAHVVNGLAVTLGLLVVQVSCALVFGAAAAQIATTGAIYASLPHLADRPGRAGRRVLAGGLLGCAAGAVVLALRSHPIALGISIGLVAFAVMLAMAWGKKAGPIAFAAVLAIVFSMAVPPSRSAVATTGWCVAGVLVYAAWAVVSTRVLERRYRVLAVAATIRASADLLRARATLLAEGSPWAWVREEAALADRLDAARDLVFPTRDTAATHRDKTLVLAVMELRDVLLASALDLDRLGDDAFATEVRARLAGALRTIAGALDTAYDALRTGVAPAAPAPVAIDVDLVVDPDDPRRRLLPALVNRVRHLADDVATIHGVLRGSPDDAALSFAPAELARFVAEDRWPLATLRDNLGPSSPVLRHAVRVGLALSTAYFLARALPWATHPYWIVLTVAVVLRGTLDQTIARRNQRVVGTAIGCAFSLLVAGLLPPAASRLLFPIAAGTAHAFVQVRYVLTASAGTVMALLQTHLVTPGAPFAAGERLADTVAGALLAWAFSYVLPSWERRRLPIAIARSHEELRAYARLALSTSTGVDVDQRLARQRAYEALEAVSAALQRSAVEPRRVRPPARALLGFVDEAQRLMAHLSSVRLLLVRRRTQLGGDEARAAIAGARDAVDALLAPGRSAPPGDEAPLELDEPAQPPQELALPWLLRRLRVTVRDAGRVARAAGVAVGALKQGSPARDAVTIELGPRRSRGGPAPPRRDARA